MEKCQNLLNCVGFLTAHRILVFITHGHRRHNVENRHATLLAMTVNEATLSHEMLFAVGHQDVVNAVKRREDCLVSATLELAGFLWSFKSMNGRKFSQIWSHFIAINSHFFFNAIQQFEKFQRFTESHFGSLGGSIMFDAFELMHPSTQLDLTLRNSLVPRQ